MMINFFHNTTIVASRFKGEEQSLGSVWSNIILLKKLFKWDNYPSLKHYPTWGQVISIMINNNNQAVQVSIDSLLRTFIVQFCAPPPP